MRVGAREWFAHGNGPRLARAGALVAATLAIGIALIPAGRASARITTPSRPPAAAHPAAPSPAQSASQRAIQAQAARQAIAQSTVPDTCSGAISPDTIYPCSTPASSGTDTFTFTLASATDRVFVWVMSVSGSLLGFAVTAPDSSTVNCQPPHDVYLCATSQAGTYTLAVTNGGSAYTVEFTPTAGCATWPQSGFDGTWGATVTVAAGGFQCLAIPADQHSTGEMIDYSNPANVANGAIDVYDPVGNHVCMGHSTGLCAYQAGLAYTAIISTTIGDTYHLARRDVSQAATCAAPASTAVGGSSTAFTLTSALDARCYRVTAATADKLWLSARSPAGPVLLQVTDSSGHWLCSQSPRYPSCKLTGSSQYQLIVTTINYAGGAITGHLDAWRVGDASGWAAECTAHHLIAANGFPLTSGILTEQATAYCAVIDVQSIQRFDIPGTTTASYPDMPDLDVWTTAHWDPSPPSLSGICSSTSGQFGARCSPGHLTQVQQDLLVLDLGTAPGGTGYTMQGICGTQCPAPPPPATLTQVSPAAQPAHVGNVVLITGANLTLDTKVALASNGTSRESGTPASVNSAGTSLTVTFDTSGLTPGQYDMVLDSPGYTVGTPSPGYLPGAYTVTAAPPAAALPRFTAVSPARILDTRSGLGAAKAKVKAHATVTLTVAGKGGVPASNATAVALEVTAVSPAAAGYLIAYPAGKARPGVSDLSFASGQTATNLIVVPLNGGKASIYNAGGGTLDLTADVAGYYAGNAGSKLTTMTPSRLLNTTTGLGAAKAPLAAHGTVAFTVTGRFAIPATGVTAVALSVTALSPKAAGALTVYPNGTSRPAATSLSFAAGQTVTSLVIVRLVNGKASLYNNSVGTVQLYADAVGYYSPTGSSSLPLTAQRVLDTRSGLGASGKGLLPHASAVTRVASVAALAGKNVTAVALEVTVTAAQQPGSLTAFADSTRMPSAYSLRFAASRSVTGLVIVPVVNGSIDFYNNSAGTIAVIADLVGYYTP